MLEVQVHVHLSGLERFQYHIENSTGPIRVALKQWAHRYRTFAQRRFLQYSRGGGDWPPLKNKRKRGAKENAAILYDTGTMFRALDPGGSSPGAYTQEIHFGVRVGYGGPHRHGQGGASIADIALYHDRGMGRLPKRQIIVPPDATTLSFMAQDMTRGLQRAAADV